MNKDWLCKCEYCGGNVISKSDNDVGTCEDCGEVYAIEGHGVFAYEKKGR